METWHALSLAVGGREEEREGKGSTEGGRGEEGRGGEERRGEVYKER